MEFKTINGKKYHCEYQIWADYGDGYQEIYAEFNRPEGLQRLKEYRTNAPQYSYKLYKKWKRGGD